MLSTMHAMTVHLSGEGCVISKLHFWVAPLGWAGCKAQPPFVAPPEGTADACYAGQQHQAPHASQNACKHCMHQRDSYSKPLAAV